MSARSVVVVGGGLGGLSVAEKLRGLGFTGPVTMVGDEPVAPYDRPPLSKEVLKGTRPNPPALRKDEDLEKLDVTMLLGVDAVGLDPAARTVSLSDGRTLPYDALVIATGARPRQWALGAGLSQVRALRTTDDAAYVAGVIAGGGRLGVLGAGFIGCEVAASARELGSEVTMIEVLAAPLARVVGEAAGAEVARRHREAGVDLRVATTVDAVAEKDGSLSLSLSDGTTVEVDGLVVGLGVIPNTEWLESSGVAIENGIVCDGAGATSLPEVYALGDVARWVNKGTGLHARIEHWTNTVDQAAIVAAHIAEGEHARPHLEDQPYFWSDQYGVKLQSVGVLGADLDVEVVLTGPGGDRPFYLYSEGDRLVGVLGFGLPRLIMTMRGQLAAGTTVQEARATAARLHPPADAAPAT